LPLRYHDSTFFKSIYRFPRAGLRLSLMAVRLFQPASAMRIQRFAPNRRQMPNLEFPVAFHHFGCDTRGNARAIERKGNGYPDTRR
jgi:hypothetical protein